MQQMRKNDYRVISLVPISNKNGVITSGIWKWDRNSWPTKNPDSSKTTSSLVKCKRREIVKASNLILHLENVCEILPWGYWACCSIYTILKRIPPILNSVPIFFTPKKKKITVIIRYYYKFSIASKVIVHFVNQSFSNIRIFLR